ncbi:hypothetical protein [Kangiella shandongensis]|uniref:hypothetical protein n=1 Tax=Kangiella shandongensis TaxID=2763258 RepID=UPI001CC0E8E3|nr:hypothetical protein [Kangiella shandongensis]
MMNKQRVTLIGIAVAFAISGPAVLAKGKPPHAGKQNEKAAEAYDDRLEDAQHRLEPKPDRRERYFDDRDRNIISDYYDRHYHDRDYREANRANLPPGLQKKYERTGQLPPGWAKKLNRGDVLPIDIYRHGHEVPYDLRRRLPIGPIGSKIIEVEGKIIRVMENTREIIDILDIGF